MGGQHQLPTLPEEDCTAWPGDCAGRVWWQSDGAKRCERHQRIEERRRRKERLIAAAVVGAVIVAIGVVANLLIRADEGPSQARAWEVCHESARAAWEDAERFADLPADPSERVKLVLGSDLYRVYSFYQLPREEATEFACTVRYLGNDEWEVTDLTVRP